MNTSLYIENSDFWRICVDRDVCHCDYRMTLQGCVEHDAYLYINYVSLAWSALCSVLVLGIVGWRVLYRGQKIVEFHGLFPRVKPIESLGLFGGLFNFSRMIHSIILITDVAPWPTFRLFMFDLSWQLGFTAFTCYFFGVSHTLSVSNRVIFKAWVGSTTFFEAVSTATILVPFTVPTIFNIMSGIYATQGNMALAGKYTSVNYYCWAVFAFVLAILIMFAGLRLVALLNDHLSSQLNRHNNMAKIKTGALKIKITMLAGCATLICLAIIACLYAAARFSITLHPSYSITLATIVNFIGPATSTVICLAVLLNPAIVSTLGFWSFGSISESQSLPPPFESNIPSTIPPPDHLFYHALHHDIKLDHDEKEPDLSNTNRLENDQMRYNCTTEAIRLQRPWSPSKPNTVAQSDVKDHLPASG